MNNFRVLKLNSGESIFAEIFYEDDLMVTIYDPMKVETTMYKSEDGKIRESNILTPWIPYTHDQKFDLSVSSIQAMGDLKNEYIRFYGQTLLEIKIKELQHEELSKATEITFNSVVEDISFKSMLLVREFRIKYGLIIKDNAYSVAVKDGLDNDDDDDDEFEQHDDYHTDGAKVLH